MAIAVSHSQVDVGVAEARVYAGKARRFSIRHGRRVEVKLVPHADGKLAEERRELRRGSVKDRLQADRLTR